MNLRKGMLHYIKTRLRIQLGMSLSILVLCRHGELSSEYQIAIGYSKLEKTFERILSELPFISYKLIDLSIKLNHKGIPVEEVYGYEKLIKPNK